MPGILGTKLRKFREDLGMTQEALAKAVGLSSEFISQLELGKRRPSLETLKTLANFLKKDIACFLQEKEEVFDFLFRGDALDEKAKAVMRRFKTHCEDYLMLEKQIGRSPDPAPLYRRISAERMAEEERRRLNLGSEPVRDIFSLLEINGLHLFRHHISEESQVSGIFLYLEEEEASFALINSAQSLGQQVFTAVHEYCHYLKDRYDGPIIDNPDIFIDEYLSLYHPREHFAQKFAAHFLMPKHKVKEIIEKDIRKFRLEYEDVIYLKRYFGVSAEAMLRTLREMECISQTKFKEYQKLDTKQHEEILFGDLREDTETMAKRGREIISDRFISLAFEVHRKKKINQEKLSKLIKKNKAKLESIAKK